jgi:hypothetical protein
MRQLVYDVVLLVIAVKLIDNPKVQGFLEESARAGGRNIAITKT